MIRGWLNLQRADYKVVSGFSTLQGVGAPNAKIVQGSTVCSMPCYSLYDIIRKQYTAVVKSIGSGARPTWIQIREPPFPWW